MIYCTCEAPVIDVDHDAACRRCGNPVDFTPASPPYQPPTAAEVEAALAEVPQAVRVLFANHLEHFDRLNEIVGNLSQALALTDQLDDRRRSEIVKLQEGQRSLAERIGDYTAGDGFPQPTAEAVTFALRCLRHTDSALPPFGILHAVLCEQPYGLDRESVATLLSRAAVRMAGEGAAQHG